MNNLPSFLEEKRLQHKGYKYIAGVDEVGRGPLAGPVVAAAVILATESNLPWFNRLNDSKKLSPSVRESLATHIQEEAISFGIGMVPPIQIDTLGIVDATKLAMRIAIEKLSITPDALLIDAVKLNEIAFPQKSIIKGDTISRSIAAASIIAKVHRDKIMVSYDSLYPGYGFARNMGYGTREHIEKLEKIGDCPIHRTSFAPVARVIERNG